MNRPGRLDKLIRDPITVGDIAVPGFLYGTAWKEDDTARLTSLALASGFRGIDTANQRRHYHEAAVGDALTRAFELGDVAREELFLQSKFTYRRGQDHRLPYDPEADLPTQVRQSFASTLEHLHIDWLDSYVLHGPAKRHVLSDDDMKVWQTMEELHREGKIRLLGVSNVSAAQLDALCERAAVRPTFVQNRCYARYGWDGEVRAVCRAQGVVYQGFSLLTANRAEQNYPAFATLIDNYQRTAAQLIFRFARQLGMVRLSGTSDPAHMREDLATDDFEIAPADMQILENISD